MAAVKPLLHVGMAKAASTFFQNELFCSLDNLHYMGKRHVADDVDRARMKMVRAMSLNWKPDEVAAVFDRELAEAASNGKRPVLSDEDFSVFKFLDPATSVGRVRKMFGPVDILFVIRHPLSWLRSQYLFRLSTLEPRAVLGFREWFRLHSRVVGIGSDITEIRFAELANVYRQIGGGRVTVVPMELIKNDREAFAGILADILDAPREEIMARLDVPPDKRRHKIRISMVEQEMLETARWIVLRRDTKLRREQDRLVEQYGLTMPDECTSQRDELIEKQSYDIQPWRTFYRAWIRANSQVFAEHPKAQPELGEPQQKRVARILERQLQMIDADFDTPLPGFPIVYGRDEAVAAERVRAGGEHV